MSTDFLEAYRAPVSGLLTLILVLAVFKWQRKSLGAPVKSAPLPALIAFSRPLGAELIITHYY